MANYYVRKSMGNDADTGLSPDHAWLTLAYAIANTIDTDIVYVGSGSYGEPLDLTNLDNRTYIGDIRGLETGDAGHPKITYIRAYTTDEDDHSNIVVKGFHCLSSTATGDYRASAVVAIIDTVNIEKCILDYGCFAGGIGGSGFTFKNNAVWPLKTVVHHRGCFACGSLPYAYIYHNTFVGIPKDEPTWVGPLVELWGYSSPTCHFNFKNNIFYQTHTGYIYYVDVLINGYHVFVFDYNCYYRSVGGTFMEFWAHGGMVDRHEYFTDLEDWQASANLRIPEFSIVADPSSFTKDPLLQGDEYHLTPVSPCIDAGTDLGVNEDIDEDFRPLGAGPDIGCDEQYYFPPTSEDTFTFEVSPRARVGPVLIRETPYREPQLKWTCTHNLPSGQYTLYTCPRCLGKGYFYDIKFDAGGLIPQVWDETKLAQELEKITITDFNPFHPEYGAKLKSRVGQVSKDDLKAIIKADLLNAVSNLMKYQKREANKGTEDGYFSPRELIDRVKKVEIVELSTTELSFVVYIFTVEGKELEITGKVLV